MVLASSSGSNRYWSFERIETALDGNLPRCSSHGPHLAYSVGVDIPNFGDDHIDELARTIARACCNQNRDGSNGSAALRRPLRYLDDISLG
jgi:hypothetical protein